jgi:hypothetical protein
MTKTAMMEPTKVTDAQRVYNVLFPGTIPPELAARFAAAWQILAADYAESEHRKLRRALSLGGDLEAIELAGRWRKQLPSLAAQVRLMCMLAETRPDHARYFFQAGNGRLAGFCALGWAGVRSAMKYLKGAYLLWRINKYDSCHCG